MIIFRKLQKQEVDYVKFRIKYNQSSETKETIIKFKKKI